MKKTLVIAGAVTAVAVSSLAGASAVFAHNKSNSQDSSVKFSNTDMAAKIAERFDLNKDEVQKVFEEEHTARKVEFEKRFNERLDQAVKDGKLTQAQADALKAKHQEMKDYLQSVKDKDPEEARKEMKTKMQEFKK